MSLLLTVPFVKFRMTGIVAGPFFLYDNLNPMMIPCLDSTTGSFHDAATLVDELTVTLKSLGGWDGTESRIVAHW